MEQDSSGRQGRARITAEEYNHSLSKLVSTRRKVKPSREVAFMAAFPVKASPRLHSDEEGASALPLKEAPITDPKHSKTSNTDETMINPEVKSPVDVREKLQVFVRGLLLPKTLCLQVNPETSVSELKLLVKIESDIQPQDQHLYIGRNLELCDLLSISDQGIQQDQNIELRAGGLLGGGLEEELSRNTFFLNLSHELGPLWENLSITLGFTVSELDTFKANYPGNLELQGFRMLDAWWKKQHNSAYATEKLRYALKARGRVDLALQVQDPETIGSNVGQVHVIAQPSLSAYSMDRNPRGLCMIINNIEFAFPFNRRTGSEIDAGKLANLFNKLHFDVEVKENLTAYAMLDWFKRVCLLNHSDYDCFACCILTNGALGEVYGTDGKPLAISQILGLFTGGLCWSLDGKPKMFFIQVCQGLRQETATSLRNFEETSGLGAGIPKSVPSEADFLLSYATVPGYVSYRSKSEGSWYISAMVDQITKHHNTTDMLNILTQVNKTVHEQNCQRKWTILKPVSSHSYTLEKALYLRSLLK